MKNVKPIPEGYTTVTPYLMVNGAAKLIQFLKDAFGAEQISLHEGEDRKVMNAEIRVGSSMVMVADAMRGHQPKAAMFYLYFKDCDAVFKAAVKAGGKPVIEPTNMFYGDRSGAVQDPCGNDWWIATHIEDVSPAELEKRAAQQNR
ncbi:MAG TPA: VOC family protein [Bdellovibrionota bacterium]|jgi:uncharacterized glyoxalase superfamily protein PhnB|nr:VOC family protein [Bdellovibrionota bacterium]